MWNITTALMESEIVLSNFSCNSFDNWNASRNSFCIFYENSFGSFFTDSCKNFVGNLFFSSFGNSSAIFLKTPLANFLNFYRDFICKITTASMELKFALNYMLWKILLGSLSPTPSVYSEIIPTKFLCEFLRLFRWKFIFQLFW